MEAMNGDTFIDILEDRRNTKDLYWANKPWESPTCRYSNNRSPAEIKHAVLNSNKVKNAIKEVSMEKSCSEEEIEIEAHAILDEMAHEFRTGIIRFFGYTLSKFMKRVYGKILVNKKGTEKLKSVASQYPIIYLPTHRSYADFLLVSYVCFFFNLPVPVIAAGLGMLQVILELFFSSKVPDVIIVPISISYDRTLEETLYAYELLGVPKPKESTKGLIKARKVMSDYYGNVYVRFGEQISLKEYFRNYDRSVHNLHPRSLSVCINEEKYLCRNLANHVIRMHQCNLLLSPFPLVCLIFSQHCHRDKGVHFNHLLDTVYWLEELIRRTGATPYNGEAGLAEVLSEQLKIHSNIIEAKDSYVSLKRDKIQHPESSSNVTRLKNSTIEQAIPAMFAYHYGNQALQLLVHVSMVCLSFGYEASIPQDEDDIFLRYGLLRKLLQVEFVFENSLLKKDFVHALQSLKEENIISLEGNKLIQTRSSTEKFEFLSSLLLPFLQSYSIICQHLTQREFSLPNCKKLSLQCQVIIEDAIIQGTLSDYRCLSLDIINNCISLLVIEHALTKVSNAGEVTLRLNQPSLLNILLDLEVFLPPVNSCYSQNVRLSLPTPKL